jgi:hypothetical protein
MNKSLLNHMGISVGTISILVLMIGLMTLLSTAPTITAPSFDGYGTPIPPVGGEFMPVNILQLLMPYLIIGFLGVAVILSIVLLVKRNRTR